MMTSKQRGFTLLDLVVGLGMSAMLVPVIVGATFNIARGTDRANSKTVALADIDSASRWINLDLSMAQDVLDLATLDPLATCETGTSPSMRIEWLDLSDWAAANPAHYSEYHIAPGTTLLLRNYDGAVSIVARHITSLSFCQNASGIVELDMASSFGDSTPINKALTFYVEPRTDGALQ